jgi:hypothetical protein
MVVMAGGKPWERLEDIRPAVRKNKTALTLMFGAANLHQAGRTGDATKWVAGLRLIRPELSCFAAGSY